MAKTLTDFNIKFNEFSVQELFDKYEEIGFIYPAKKALLRPYFHQITENWKKLLQNQHEYLWILTNEENNKDFASVSVWQYNNYGVQAQHLVSNGNPFLSLRTMLGAQAKAQYHFNRGEIRTSQNWFRPNNRYAYRIFASMYEKLGSRYAALNTFQYLFLRLDEIQERSVSRYTIEEVEGIDYEFIEFVKNQYGDVFALAEELDQRDLHLEKMRKIYNECGLDRYRKLLKVRDLRTGCIVSGVIANRAPIGLNFSFLENRAHYMLDRNLENSQRVEICQAIHTHLKPFYADIAIKSIPIATDKPTSKVLQYQKAEFFKEYMQSIWGWEGFGMWYEHIDSFLKRIERRA